MGKVNVIIVDATGNKEQKVGLPDDIKCGIIMVKLVEKIKLPSVGPDGNPISYKFIHKVTGRQLLETQTLGEAGIKDGDVLRLQPEITAGAVCDKCGSEIADGESFCSKCGSAVKQEPVKLTCSNCGLKLEPGEKFCAKCGAPVQKVNTQFSSMPNFTPNILAKADKLKATEKGSHQYLGGKISGILSAIMGMILFCFPTGGYETNSYYGGDAYTGIQNASAQAANNIQSLAVITKIGLGAILVFFGLGMFFYFKSKSSKK